MKEIATFIGVMALTINLVLWYWAKFIARSYGYPMSLIYYHFRDLKHLVAIAESQSSRAERRGYYLLLGGIIGSLVVFIVAAAVSLSAA